MTKTKWYPLLRRIAGRINRMFSNVILQYGAVFVPLGFAMAVYALEFSEGWRAIVGLTISAFFFIVGMIAFKDAVKIARKEERESEKRHQELLKVIKDGSPSIVRGYSHGGRSQTRKRNL